MFRKVCDIVHNEQATYKEGHDERYNVLIGENKLLFTVDLVKEKLEHAYKAGTVAEMAEELHEIMDICRSLTGNKHFLWFSNLIESHFQWYGGFCPV